ncbi:tryptophan synthase subunit beta [Reinekea forsetii]|uniref:Tryptophan synthase beta chain n=1 Tax=Reinekea forsetii TaxID=1336806 RepID=A0A2K8KSJ5_9GAMM|nr:tryptophan synthase subunit beta [Reinekea forsetii]ATX77049.1 tryptophan synthase beta chain [Reinekea forsetii]
MTKQQQLTPSEKGYASFSDMSAYYDAYGGCFIPETLMPAIDELIRQIEAITQQADFRDELSNLLATYVGRPTPLTYAKNLSDELGFQIWLKREDLAHTGAHKINNALGQALLAKRMGKHRIIAETGAGQHGVATATVCALLGLDCTIYIGSVDVERQKLNVFRMELLGAKVVPVENGTKTLKDAINEAIRDWVTNVDNTYYLLGSALGPHPYPKIVREFQKIIGIEAKQAFQSKFPGELPTAVVACVGGGSNAIGLFHTFIDEPSVRLIGIEAAGKGIESGQHSVRLAKGVQPKPGVLQGCYSFVLQNAEGQIQETHSIAPGLDYAMVGPEHAQLWQQGRAEYYSADDEQALAGLKLLTRTEGIIPALESAHAIAGLVQLSTTFNEQDRVIVNISGRGDKDMMAIFERSQHGDAK